MTKNCLNCNREILAKDHKSLRDFTVKKFCSRSCAVSMNNKLFPKKVKQPPKPKKARQISQMNSVTKDELLARSKHYQSARNTIRIYAKRCYDDNNMPKRCIVCGYDRCYEVAHVRSVADFPGHATIGEINHISNLVGLCPTHHWEYDNGFIFKEDLEKLVPAKGIEPIP